MGGFALFASLLRDTSPRGIRDGGRKTSDWFFAIFLVDVVKVMNS